MSQALIKSGFFFILNAKGKDQPAHSAQTDETMNQLIRIRSSSEGLEDPAQMPRPRGYKTFFVLNSTEHEVSTAHKN